MRTGYGLRPEKDARWVRDIHFIPPHWSASYYLLRITLAVIVLKHREWLERCLGVENSCSCRRPQVWFSAPTYNSRPFLTSWAPSTHMVTYAYLQATHSFFRYLSLLKSKICLKKRKEWRKGGVREMRSRDGIDQNIHGILNSWTVKTHKNRARTFPVLLGNHRYCSDCECFAEDWAQVLSSTQALYCKPSVNFWKATFIHFALWSASVWQGCELYLLSLSGRESEWTILSSAVASNGLTSVFVQAAV